jgi:hypothetical protein
LPSGLHHDRCKITVALPAKSFAIKLTDQPLPPEPPQKAEPSPKPPDEAPKPSEQTPQQADPAPKQ